MEIQNKKITEIIPYENNPRKNNEAVQYVTNSIQNFGFRVPIIIDKNNIIVAGHTRYKAAQLLKMKNVPCLVADDLTEEQINAFRLADNKVAEKSTWDLEMLDKELQKILDFNMSEFGFEDQEDVNFDDFFTDTEPKEKEKKLITCPNCGEPIEI